MDMFIDLFRDYIFAISVNKVLKSFFSILESLDALRANFTNVG